MLAGVGGVTACVFVVAATEGWKPQSEEHLRILELLGISSGIVVLTKSDLVDADLARARGDGRRRPRRRHLPRRRPGASPVSSTTGAGLDDLRAALDELVATSAGAVDRGRPRLWIDRVFAAKGSGTVATGTLVGGRLAADQAVVTEPGSTTARIRSIQTAGRTVESIGPGNRVSR